MLRLLLILSTIALSACEPLALSVIGAGAGTALRYNLESVTYRTFTAPAEQVKSASLSAFERMGITVASYGRFDGGELIYARTDNRDIEMEIEAISPRATRVRIAAKNGSSFFYDTATAAEIVAQTQRVLDLAAAKQPTGAKQVSIY